MTFPAQHLTYCTNIHPGETWAEVRENLARYVVPVREQLAGVPPFDRGPFGVGLRLSAAAARALADAAALAELRAFLADHGLYVFTVNGFPYGPFHGTPVKERVYRPDWLEPERLAYTDQVATVLAALLPEGVEGTVSTLPGAFAPRVGGPDDLARIGRAIARHAAHLVALEARTGRRVALALEPEPCCLLEGVGDAVAFLTEHVFGGGAIGVVARATGLSRAGAERALRERVGVCYDACHMAVAFEAPGGALAAFAGAGIRIPKVQVSAGLRVRFATPDDPALAALDGFADDVYLHQVVERGQGGGPLVRYLDLGEALAAARRAPPGAREWRVHFHVPLFCERLGPFESTRAHAAELLALLGARGERPHLEVETYSWGVLPEAYRAGGVVDAVARELAWAASQLP